MHIGQHALQWVDKHTLNNHMYVPSVGFSKWQLKKCGPNLKEHTEGDYSHKFPHGLAGTNFSFMQAIFMAKLEKPVNNIPPGCITYRTVYPAITIWQQSNNHFFFLTFFSKKKLFSLFTKKNKKMKFLRT